MQISCAFPPSPDAIDQAVRDTERELHAFARMAELQPARA